MDRFIGSTIDVAIQKNIDLKSNMDRFIAVHGMRTNYTILI